ncbi:hypothetical protein B0H14DRAFT_2580860 [Mycena olivaceomarginata]|nr:hypothetical protein B0H14DRAFT_2580860 [Mycena olivaceomarginata]
MIHKMIVRGMHEATLFYNTDPANTFEILPSKDGAIPRLSPFLERSDLQIYSLGDVFALPDGKVFMVAGNQSIIYDIEAKTETILPDILNGVRVTNPMDGSATLLPISPPHYIPEILDPASHQCNRITPTPARIEKGWEVERMLERRIMPELILLPNGQVLTINDGQTGYAAMLSVGDLVGNSDADNATLIPSLYDSSAPLGQRISNEGLLATTIARMYHSSVGLTPSGNILVAGSNPNSGRNSTVKFSTEYRVEYLNPPYMFSKRSTLADVPAQIAFDSKFTVNVTLPNHDTAVPKRQGAFNSSEKRFYLPARPVALMDLRFSSHAFHSSVRPAWLEATLSRDRKSLEIFSPPIIGCVSPPGPGYIFLTVEDTTSAGAHVIVGNGNSPPVTDQGRKI